MIARLIIALAMAFAVAAPAAAESLLVNGRARTYEIHVPSQLTLPAPALFALHGGAGDADVMRRYTELNDAADELGFVVVYPEGTANHWNDGRTSEMLANHPSGSSDDVGFLLALVDTLATAGTIDRTRTAVAGISNGGMMALRVACEAPALFAAYTVVAANVPLGIECPGGQPVAMMFIHGTEDELVPYYGGPIADIGDRDRGTAYSVDWTMNNWAVRNICTGAEIAAHLANRPLDGTTVDIIRYLGCSQPLVHIVVNGGGHTWPGAQSALYGLIAGRHSREIDANTAIWTFTTEQF